MSRSKAKRIWLDKKRTIRQKTLLIGVSAATLYRLFGKTNAPAGRPRKWL